ncbi:AAA family ATPase [Klebsiella pasteurii]|uniref:UvrD-helicase domain-containing protein n=1 Tax=Klebsiella pasteurii TaxID=2587529 RepID=UPI00287CCD4C|nr:UvrD-helicase domain-containing protein [Klebsiella pasteurii]MDS7905614.1 AAA family ATPase [Klebsiella pasteurii]MDV0994213.1 AAA family ATPase [Klebsiella pasteurii]
MITVQIAGAGAGKTHGLASQIAAKLAEAETDKKIHALTYTNTARDKIKSALKMHTDGARVNVDTVHSFLLNEIIFPYAYYILGEKYKSISLEQLPENPRYKNNRITTLKRRGIIHVENVYILAKQILDKTNAKNKSKTSKGKVDFVHGLLKNLISSIFIDEVQDLDEDCLRVFHVLGSIGIYVYMIGDPKQAIKHPNSLNNYIEEFKKEDSNVVFENINNVTRRVPNSSLRISNYFCYADQQQTNITDFEGSIHYIYNDTMNFENAIQQCILNDKLVIINQKNNFYCTNLERDNIIPYELATILEDGPKRNNRDPKIYINSIVIDLVERIKQFPDTPNNQAANHIIKIHDLSALLRGFKNGFALFYAFSESLANKGTTTNYLVKSIEAVKGLDSDIVFFILSNSFTQYLCDENIDKKNRFNKEWKKLYVALTRSKDKLVFVLDKRLINAENLEKYETFFNSKNINMINDGSECLNWL